MEDQQQQVGGDVPLPEEAQQAMPGFTPIIMTKQQYEDLGGIVVAAQSLYVQQTMLAQAVATIDRCDGSVPELTRTYVRALDGYASETDMTALLLLKLAKATASGDLLEEIRRWTNTREVSTWADLRAHILEHFLSACETLKLQSMLEQTQQRLGESISTYIRRFRAEAERAYPEARAATEETRVVSSFLRGFADRPFAERLFRTRKTSTLAEVIASALDKDAERERMEQTFAIQGHTPMEIGSIAKPGTALVAATADGDIKTQLDQLCQKLTQIDKRTQQTAEAVKRVNKEATPPESKQGQTGGQQQKPKQNYVAKYNLKWTKDGRPICSHCRLAGHTYRLCGRRQAGEAAATAQPAGNRQ